MTNSIAASHRTGIGGSTAAAVLGLSRYRSKHEALGEILGLAPEKEPSELMLNGKDLEPGIRAIYERMTGYKGSVPGDEQTFRHPKYEWLICHPDWLGDDGERIAEFKTANRFNQKEWGDPRYTQVPIEYAIQCWHNMIVTGRRKCDLAVLMGNELLIYPIEWDRDQALRIFNGEREFWERHVVAGEPLPIDGSDGCKSLMAWMHKDVKEPLDFATGETAQLLNAMADVDINLEAETGNWNELANKIKDAIGSREGLRTDKIVCTWKPRKDGVRVFKIKLTGNDGEFGE